MRRAWATDAVRRRGSGAQSLAALQMPSHCRSLNICRLPHTLGKGDRAAPGIRLQVNEAIGGRMFPEEVCDKLGFYVYRLIDPRNGETFYVGKGRRNRVFAHVKGELGADVDVLSEKLQRIRAIRAENFEVGHLIHRHGLDEATAIEVEAALIDAYPEAENIAGGQYSGERGLMHSQQIITRYAAPEAVFSHTALLITLNKTATEKENIYEAVRYAWKLDVEKARKAELVMAVLRGIIVGVYVAESWHPATPQYFPTRLDERPKRYGFIGHPASADVADLYLRRRLPDDMRKPGAANPIRYV